MSNAGKKTGKPLSDRHVPGPEAQASVSNSGAADQVHSLGVGGDQSGNAGGEGGGGPAAGDSAADMPDADGTANSSDSASAAGPVVTAADVGGTESPAPASVVAQSGVEALPTSAAEPSDSIVISPPEPGPSSTSAVNPGEVEVFPLRTYQDAGELRRRGGKGYVVDKRHAVALVQRGLATLEDPEG